MGKWSHVQIQSLERQTGFPDIMINTRSSGAIPLIALMSAISYQESGGNSEAINPGVGAGGRRTNEYSVGLYQINTYAHKNYSVAQLKNPTINAKEALRIYKSQGLRAWGGYTDGGYKKYLSGALSAYRGGGGSVAIIDIPQVNQIINSNALPAPAPMDDTTKYIVYGAIGFLGLLIITR